MQVITVAAAALLALTPVVRAASAIVHNKCNFDVYLWSVDADTNPQKPTILASGGSYSEKYRTPSQGGVSIKLSNSTSIGGPITQFEYTLAGNIWYDLSNVNCRTPSCPFENYGMYMESGDGCPKVSCAAGDGLCSGVYNKPDDDQASLCCKAEADIVAYLCVDTPSGSAPSAAPSVASSSAPAASASAIASSGSTVVASAVPTTLATTATAPLSTTYGAATTKAASAAAATSATSTVAASSTRTRGGWHRHTARAAVHHPHMRV